MIDSPLKQTIRELASLSGYDLCGFSSLDLDDIDKENYIKYITEERQGTMDWLKERLPFRLYPEKVFPGAKCALVLGVMYRDLEFEKAISASRWKISRYAAGRDYHRVLRKKGKKLLAEIRKIIPEARGRI